MTGSGINFAAALREVLSALQLHGRALAERAAGNLRPEQHHYRSHLLTRRSPWLRRCLIGTGVVVFAAIASCGIVWLQLAAGPISVDLLTPLLTSAIEQRLGSGHRVEVGGTVLERDETGRSALRLRDIVVRDAQGVLVAAAPKAEVGLTSLGLLTGRIQADRLSLIGAAMALRIEPGGQVDITAGANEPPPAATPSTNALALAGAANAGTVPTVEVTSDPLAAVLAWIDKLDSLGLDGGSLSEIGLKDGMLIVDDQRHGKRWTFEHINLSLTRPAAGGIAFAVNSTGADGLWSLTATVTPKPDGKRTIEAVIRDVSPKDLMLALRASESHFAADVPLSAVIRAEIERDGSLQSMEGRILAGAGYFGSRDDPDSRVHIDEAQLNLRWNAVTRQLEMPFDARSGPSRVSFASQLDVPAEAGTPWMFAIPRGLVVFASADRSQDPPLIIDRVSVRARIDTARRQFEIDQADLGGMAGGFAISGTIDYSGPDPRLAIGVAGTRMTVSALKRLWPALVTPRLRSWVVERITGGMVEKVVVATNAPLSTLEPGGPPLPDDGLSVDLVTSGSTVRPVDGLPVLRDADLVTRVQGRTATVRVNKAMVDLPSGRKITLTNGVFEVPDTHPKPSPARTRFRAEGEAAAAAELLSIERLRDSANVSLDPATTKGNFVAQIGLDYTLIGALTKDNLDYQIDADLTNFSAEKWVRGQKVEAAALKLVANSQGFYTRGDVKIGGLPATVDYRKPSGDRDAEVRIQAVLDDAGRTRLGLGMNEVLSGPVPFKLTGRVGSSDDRESRYQIEADLRDSKISELLPGWWKAAGKATKVTFTAIDKPQVMRFDDIVIEGPGTLVKGMIELDANNEIVLASFPTFALSDGDKATLRADRAPDGTLKVTMRGELFDGRGFIKSSTNAPVSAEKTKPPRDFDLDVKIGTVTGYNVEALRGVEVRLSRRNGYIRTFGMIGRLGSGSSVMGDVRSYPGGRRVIYLESSDAGALLRFTDIYSRVVGGQMWMAMDPPTGDQGPQEGVINVRDFSIRGEQELQRVATNENDGTRAAQNFGAGVGFTRMRAEFTRSPGRLALRDGVAWSPAMGATIEGAFDYQRDLVSLRGTFVPAYALNNFLARIPVIGFFVGGGQNEGVFGMTYEVVGPTGNATLRVNPIAMMAPGFLRKIFEFRNADDSKAVPPYSSPTR